MMYRMFGLLDGADAPSAIAVNDLHGSRGSASISLRVVESITPILDAPFHGEGRVEQSAGSAALDGAEAGRLRERGEFFGGALAAFRADEHVERLHVRRNVAGIEELLSDQ